MTNVLYISDFFDTDLVGGGELNDGELCRSFDVDNYTLSKLRSHTVQHTDLDKFDFFIISNFINLNASVLDKLTSKNYIIYEHDHKYLINRNPAEFKDYKAPSNFIINKDFYSNAKSVFCQTSFHKEIIQKNLNIDNIFVVSGNLWSEKSLSLMSELQSVEKEDKVSIMHSNTPHKNTRECVFYCEKKNIDYELISSTVYEDFLSMLSKNKKFIFLPKTPETLSRVVVEASMIGV